MMYDYAFPLPSTTDAYGNHQLGQQGMSLREYAAIALRIPDSGDPQLDDMIRKAKRDEFAAAALTGILSNPNANMIPDIVRETERAADAMMAGFYR